MVTNFNGHRRKGFSLKENRRFNRLETEHDHYYIQEFGHKASQEKMYRGYLKAKLAHTQSVSVIIPDQIFLEEKLTKKLLWFQPLNFLPNLLIKDEDEIVGLIYVDISCGNTIKLEFRNTEFIKSYEDGSNLFHCNIYGPEELETYATGSASFKANHVPYLDLYHHTSKENYEKIIKTSFLIASKWNIQGNKKLKNIAYVYFTCLDEVKKMGDLKQIAMASDGKIHLIRDNFNLPPFLPEDWRSQYSKDILELEVYRESTFSRTETIRLSINSVLLASQHILKHSPSIGGVYYQICNPFIYRVGLLPGRTLRFINDEVKVESHDLKQFDYVVLGDATTLEGLGAPYDEENTSYVFKIEKSSKNTSLLDFWFENGNSDLFSNRSIEVQEFED